MRQASDWYLWGPYLSERQRGTVREDYSPDGEAWSYLPHDRARSQTYRWGEDGLAGFCDVEQRLCVALAVERARPDSAQGVAGDGWACARATRLAASAGSHGITRNG